MHEPTPDAPELDEPLTRAKLHALAESGRLRADHIRTLLEVCERDAPWRAPSAVSWRRFVSAHLLAIGVLLLAAGAAFFLAANWSALSGLVRMGLVAVVLASSAAIGARLGLDRVGGRAALTLAGLLIGPLLAVYGQTYQTGADAYELFLGWGLLLTPFVLLVRWTGLLVLQVSVLELAFALYADQVHAAQAFDDPWVHVGLAAMNALALVGFEAWRALRASRGAVSGGEASGGEASGGGASGGGALGGGALGGDARWPSRVFLVAALFFLLPRLMERIADRGLGFALESMRLELFVVSVAIVGTWLWYRRAPKDVFALAAAGLSLVALAACVVLDALEGRFSYRNDEWVFVLTGVFVLVATGLVGVWIRAHLRGETLDEDDGEDAWDDAPRAPGAEVVRDGLRVREALSHAAKLGASLPVSIVLEVLRKPAQPPLAVRVLLGLGIWIGAALFAAILGLVEDLLHAGSVRALGGVLLLVAAAVVSRQERWGDVRIHLTIIVVMLGELLLISVFPRDDDLMFLCAALLQVAIVVLVANPLTRFASTLLALLSLWLLINFELDPPRHGSFPNDLLFVAISLGAVLVWLGREAILASRAAPLQAPVGYGLAVGVVGMAALNFVGDISSISWVSFAAPEVVSVGLVVIALGMVLVLRLERAEREGAPRTRSYLLPVVALAGGLVVLVLGRHPELLGAMLLIGLGHARRERGLYGLGIALLGAGLIALYYEMSVTLLVKSAALAGTGAVLLVVRQGLIALFGDPGSVRKAPLVEEKQGLSFEHSVAVPGLVEQRATGAAALLARYGRGAVALAVTLALAVPFGLAADRERIARHGALVLLELAPRDPRSILQGDYMTLHYAGFDPLTSSDEWGRLKDGTLVLALDARSVGRFVRVHDGEPLADDEVRLRFRKRGYSLRIGAESYFFEEGQAARYETARYGELRVSEDGEVVLVGLRNAALQRL